MAEAVFVSIGNAIDYTPSGSALAAGQVVDLGNMIGVAVTDIADGELGALQVEGIYNFAKYTGQAINRGEVVYWDDGTNTATTTGAYGEAVAGIAVATAAAGDATVKVKLIPGLGDALA